MKGLNRYTVIAGCAGIAAVLAGMLSAQGGDVLVIARSREAFSSIAPSFKGCMLVGDYTDIDVLGEANIEKADTFVAATDDDNVNLLVAQLAREACGVERVVAIVNDAERECVYRALGVASVSPVLIAAEKIAGELFSEKKEDAL